VKQLPLSFRLPAHAVFDSFATGANTEVVAALKDSHTTPLWLWGARASGKTHLLQATCAAAAGAYFPLDRSLELPPEALQGFEQSRVLCIDDVDKIAGLEDWERALFQLFNAASEVSTKLVFAADLAPRQIEWQLEDWRSRAGACVVYQLQDLDDDGRSEALRLRAAQRGLDLPPETCDYLLKRMPRDLPSLCRILDELDQASLVAQRRLTIPFIRVALAKHAGTKS
jgi:DnaA family protein